MTIYLPALLLGVVTGMRSMTAPTLARWGAHPGVLVATRS